MIDSIVRVVEVIMLTALVLGVGLGGVVLLVGLGNLVLRRRP